MKKGGHYMLDLTKVIFTDQLIVNEGLFLLVDMSPAIDETTSERIGTDIEVALTGQRYEKIRVRVPYPVTCSAFESVTVQSVEFKGFKGYFKQGARPDQWEFIATADHFQLVG